MVKRKNHAIAFHYGFRARNFHNSFGRNSNNTWHELPDKIKNQLRDIVETRDGLTCCTKYHHGCGTTGYLTIDHIIPIRAGGPVADIGNLQLLCIKCHDKKTATIDVQYTSIFQRRKRTRQESHTV